MNEHRTAEIKVGRGMTACREVAACPLESVRQQHAKWVKSTLENLSKLDAYLEKADFITEAVRLIFEFVDV